MSSPMSRRHNAPDSNKITKKASPRNSKAWTLEDVRQITQCAVPPTNCHQERALLQGRLERVPYKQIGARIGKTDLACRLHFHQMVMAKRTPETPPGRSIVFLSSEHPPEVHRLAPTHPAANASMALSTIYSSNNSPDANHRRDPFHRRSLSSPHSNHNHSEGWRPVASPYADLDRRRQVLDKVDLGRLNNIYQEHAGDFWSTIAAKYSGGSGHSPFELEHAFLHARSADEVGAENLGFNFTLTEPPENGFESREHSPNAVQLPELRHVRSSSDTSIVGKCSVESLLNHTKG